MQLVEARGARVDPRVVRAQHRTLGHALPHHLEAHGAQSLELRLVRLLPLALVADGGRACAPLVESGPELALEPALEEFHGGVARERLFVRGGPVCPNVAPLVERACDVPEREPAYDNLHALVRLDGRERLADARGGVPDELARQRERGVRDVVEVLLRVEQLVGFEQRPQLGRAPAHALPDGAFARAQSVRHARLRRHQPFDDGAQEVHFLAVVLLARAPLAHAPRHPRVALLRHRGRAERRVEPHRCKHNKHNKPGPRPWSVGRSVRRRVPVRSAHPVGVPRGQVPGVRQEPGKCLLTVRHSCQSASSIAILESVPEA